MKTLLAFFLSAMLSLTVAFAQPAQKPKPADDDMKDCPMHAQHAKHAASSEHAAAVDARGDQAMGFSHDATFHHFRSTDDGGAIEATTKDPADAASLAQIRAHMKDIARMFSEGDFSLPHFIHGETPAGVPAMKRLGALITYRYEELPAGARVRISTTNPEALKAVHEFVRYQVAEHRTGDDMTNMSDHSHKH